MFVFFFQFEILILVTKWCQKNGDLNITVTLFVIADN